MTVTSFKKVGVEDETERKELGKKLLLFLRGRRESFRERVTDDCKSQNLGRDERRAQNKISGSGVGDGPDLRIGFGRVERDRYTLLSSFLIGKKMSDSRGGGRHERNQAGRSGSTEERKGSSPKPANDVGVVQPEQDDYSGLAAKTVANIRRLQENVMSVNIVSPASHGGVGPASSSSSSSSRTPTTLSLNNSAFETESGDSNCAAELEVSSGTSPEKSGAENTLLSPDGIVQSSTPCRVTPTGAKTQSVTTSPLPVISDELTTSFNALVTIDPQWQSSKFNLRDRNAVMFNNALMADVWFSVGSDALLSQIQKQDVGQKPFFSRGAPSSPVYSMPKKIPAHKYVLATASTVFYAMFYGGLAERDLKEPIEVPDVEPGAFLVMLKYIYCDDVDVNPDNVLATLYVAKKYIVPYLAQACVGFLESSLTAKNSCLLLAQSRLFDEQGLMQRSWEVIDAQAEMALSSDGFTEIDFLTMKAILARETLNCRETVVFKAAVSWAEAECQRQGISIDDPEEKPLKCREVLGNALYLIRFTSMTVQEFADTVATSGVLTLQETTDMFLHFTARQKPSIGSFSSKTRIGLPRQICHRFLSSHYRSNQWRYRGRTDSIQFSVDRRIFIVGFGLYGSSNGSSDYAAHIELKSSPGFTPFGRNRVLAENTVKFFSDGSSNTFKVYFKQPVQIEPEIYYTASAILDGSELSYFGQEGMSEVTVGSVTFQFQSSSESTNGTGVQGGQIPELIFFGPSPLPKALKDSKSESAGTVSAPDNVQEEGSAPDNDIPVEVNSQNPD